MKRTLIIFFFIAVTSFAWSQEAGYAINKKVTMTEAQFPGGEIAFYSYIIGELQKLYDEESVHAGGVVKVQFTIDTAGSVTDLSILESLDKTLDEESMNILKRMPKWKPGAYFENVPRPCTYVIPFNYIRQTKPGE